MSKKKKKKKNWVIFCARFIVNKSKCFEITLMAPSYGQSIIKLLLQLKEKQHHSPFTILTF